MKRLIVGLFLALFLVGVVSAFECSDADFDGDGVIGQSDALIMNYHLSYCLDIGKEWKDCYNNTLDLNEDGEVNMKDESLLFGCRTCDSYDINSDGAVDEVDESYCWQVSGEYCEYYLYTGQTALVGTSQIKLLDVFLSSWAGQTDEQGRSLMPAESTARFDIDGEQKEMIGFQSTVITQGDAMYDLALNIIEINGLTIALPKLGADGQGAEGPVEHMEYALLRIKGGECKGILPRPELNGLEGCGDSFCDAFTEGRRLQSHGDNKYLIKCLQDCGVNGEFINEPVCGDTFCDSSEGRVNSIDSNGKETSRIVCPEDCAGGYRAASWTCADGEEFNQRNLINCDYSFS